MNQKQRAEQKIRDAIKSGDSFREAIGNALETKYDLNIRRMAEDLYVDEATIRRARDGKIKPKRLLKALGFKLVAVKI